MSLLGASRASGSMAIKDAHTYGVDGYMALLVAC